MSVLDRAAWDYDAACKDTDPDAFYLGNGTRVSSQVKRLCVSCPVREQCLTAALAEGDQHAIMGGTTPGTRERIKAGLVTIDQVLSQPVQDDHPATDQFRWAGTAPAPMSTT